MNPEEGELRPQLLDRFGLAVEIGGLSEVSSRVQIIKRRLEFESDPQAFIQQWSEAEQELATRIANARELLPKVQIDDTDMAIVAGLAVDLGVDGHRADLAILETARTHAAWSSRIRLTAEDIRLAAELALPHRMRRQPFTEIKVDEARIGAALERSGQQAEGASNSDQVKKKMI